MCRKILPDDLNMLCVTQHSVSCILTQDLRGNRLTIYGDPISSAGNDGKFLNQIITGDKTWHFLYNQLK